MPWLEWQTQTEMPINLDGEPITSKQQRFEVHAGALNMVLPDACHYLNTMMKNFDVTRFALVLLWPQC